MTPRAWLFGAAGLFALAAFPCFAVAAPQVFGWIEEGILLPETVSVKVKLDSGALTSSMDAREIKRFKKNGEKWVAYKVIVKDSDTGKTHSTAFERPIERLIKIQGAGGSDHRVVVKMNICIGSKVYKEEFSLNDRSKMLYPVLLGRRTIEHLGLIDVSRTFTMEPECAR